MEDKAAEVSENEEDSSELLKLPKGPVPAFILYSRDKRKALPQMSLLESTQKLSQMWKVAPSEEKEKYITASLVDKERYKNDMAVLTMKYPNAVEKLLSKRRTKKKTEPIEEAPGKKKGRKRHRFSPIHQEPPPAVPTSSSTSKVRPNCQEVKVPGTNVAIFTSEFLEYNKKVNSQLMQMRKINNDLLSENTRLEESIDDQERMLGNIRSKVEKLKQENETLDKNLTKLQEMIITMFGHLASGSIAITSADELLDHLLSKGIDRETVNSIVEKAKATE